MTPYRPLGLSFCLWSVSLCASSDCLPLTNWSVFLRAGWQVPLCLTIDRQPPHRQSRTQSLTCSHMGLCPPSPDKLSLGPQINIQAKHWLYIIESRCHECTTGATLDAATMCVRARTHARVHTPQHLAASCAQYPVCWLGAGHEYRIKLLWAPQIGHCLPSSVCFSDILHLFGAKKRA